MRTLYKLSITLGVAVASITAIMAQSLGEFTERLSVVERNESVEPFRYSNVEIAADSSAREALSRIIEQSRDDESGEIPSVAKQGYRIGIFFGNGATARAEAIEVVRLCDSLLSDLPTTMSYDNPYFKVSTGYCTSQEEAVMMLHRVQRVFPRAYRMRETITPQDIVTSRRAEILAEAETEVQP